MENDTPMIVHRIPVFFYPASAQFLDSIDSIDEFRKSSCTQQTEWLRFVLLSVSWCLTIELSVHETDSKHKSKRLCLLCAPMIVLQEGAENLGAPDIDFLVKLI